jgi:hypothetical protein
VTVEPDNPEDVIRRFDLGFPNRQTLSSGLAFCVNSSLEYVMPYLEDKILDNVYDFHTFPAGDGEIGLDLPDGTAVLTNLRCISLLVPAYYIVRDDPCYPLIPRIYNLGTGLQLRAREVAQGRCKMEISCYTPHLQTFIEEIKEDILFCWPGAPMRTLAFPTNTSILHQTVGPTTAGQQTPTAQTQPRPNLSKRYVRADRYGSNVVLDNSARDMEICRLRFEERQTYKEIQSAILRQGYKLGQERIEQICRGDVRHQAASERIA